MNAARTADAPSSRWVARAGPAPPLTMEEVVRDHGVHQLPAWRIGDFCWTGGAGQYVIGLTHLVGGDEKRGVLVPWRLRWARTVAEWLLWAVGAPSYSTLCERTRPETATARENDDFIFAWIVTGELRFLETLAAKLAALSHNSLEHFTALQSGLWALRSLKLKFPERLASLSITKLTEKGKAAGEFPEELAKFIMTRLGTRAGT
jgi:hypothetical protein